MSAESPNSQAGHSQLLRGLLFACLGSGAWVLLWRWSWANSGQIPRPFAWWDIALVSIIAWTPLGLVIAQALARFSRWRPGVFAAGLLLVSFFLTKFTLGLGPQGARLLWGALIGISMALLVQAMNRRTEKEPGVTWSLSSLLFLIPLTAIVTSAYTAERIRFHERKIAEFLEQHRLMEARRWTARLQVLDPSRTIHEQPLFMLAGDLDERLDSIRKEVAELRKQLSNASVSQSDEESFRLALAQNLAILGQVEEAAEELSPLLNRESPAAFILIATMREHQEDWDASLRYYERAQEALKRQSESAEQQFERIQAWKGIAYTQRKRGHYREAESAYQNVLELAPTAEHHFLLAQFYEDAQQGDRAQFHAYRAAEMNSRVYRDKADRLVNGMLSEQFGCWSIFRHRKP